MEICPSEMCTGCGACKCICPVSCIELQLNEEGFYYPKVDDRICIQCGKCRNICPAINEKITNSESELESYVAWHKDDKVIKESSSGGAFSALANVVLTKGGTVYGCMMDENTDIYHTRIEKASELYKLRGSKYVQSDTRSTFIQVKKDLEESRYVLYSGCPCQISGLYAFLNSKNYNNLLTVDLVCHGAASLKFFNQYIEELEFKYNDKITNINFRSKEKKVSGFLMKISFKNRESIFTKAMDDEYMSCFLHSAIYRPCCYKCQYANLNRTGDFTIGDFVGVNPKYITRDVFSKGVSLITTNNLKAKSLLKILNNDLNYIKRPLSEATNTNYNLILPSKEPGNREDVLHRKDLTVKQKKEKYCKFTIKARLASVIKPTSLYRKYYLNKIKKQTKN